VRYQCCLLGLVAALGFASDARAQSMRGPWATADPPPREVTFSATSWSRKDALAGAAAVTFTRNLSRFFAIEARGDVGPAGPFGSASIQLRGRVKREAAGFVTLGYVHAVAPRTNPRLWRDRAISFGLGVQRSVTQETAFRFDGQVLHFKGDRHALRLSAGITVTFE
jgi:hypothetical protein